MGPPLTYKNWCIEGILSPQSEADSFSFILTGLLNLGDNGDKVQRKRRAVWDVALPLFLIMQPRLHYMGKAIHVPPERMQHLNLKHEALWDSAEQPSCTPGQTSSHEGWHSSLWEVRLWSANRWVSLHGKEAWWMHVKQGMKVELSWWAGNGNIHE